MNYTLSEAYSFVGTKNLQFERNWERWQFLLESYVGGEEYRRGAHLVRYALETQGEYEARLRSTPLDNQCKSVISVYMSFLFREPPTRDLSSIQDDLVDDFLRDCDLDGRSFNSFMKDVASWSSVFGHCFVLMTKPSVEAQTLADQRAAGVRPYVNLLTPLVVTDWKWSRRPNGRYDITYIKYIEDVNDSVTTIREWTPEIIRTWEMDDTKREAILIEEQFNELGRVPVVLVYNQRSQVRGIGISDISDIADMQRAIYNEFSEVEQSVRLEGHPSLVTTPDTQIGAGAGALIQMPDNLDPGLKPYMLNADATPINMIYESIRNRVEAIDKMANTGGVRAVESRTVSGVALETEFQLLNARLSEKADNMEVAEEQIWELYCVYESKQWMGSIDYPGSFNIRDTGREYDQLLKASQTTEDPAVIQVINERLVELLGEEPEDVFVVETGLPDAYVPANTPGVPANQNCANCEYYDDITQNCSKWDETVNPVYWCRAWDGHESESEEYNS
jgi:hypothetical protein